MQLDVAAGIGVIPSSTTSTEEK